MSTLHPPDPPHAGGEDLRPFGPGASLVYRPPVLVTVDNHAGPIYPRHQFGGNGLGLVSQGDRASSAPAVLFRRFSATHELEQMPTLFPPRTPARPHTPGGIRRTPQGATLRVTQIREFQAQNLARGEVSKWWLTQSLQPRSLGCCVRLSRLCLPCVVSLFSVFVPVFFLR